MISKIKSNLNQIKPNTKPIKKTTQLIYLSICIVISFFLSFSCRHQSVACLLSLKFNSRVLSVLQILTHHHHHHRHLYFYSMTKYIKRVLSLLLDSTPKKKWVDELSLNIKNEDGL